MNLHAIEKNPFLFPNFREHQKWESARFCKTNVQFLLFPSSVVLHDGVHPAEVLVHVRVGGGLQAEPGGPVVVPEAGHAVDGGGAVGGADAAVAAGVALGKKSN